MKTYACEKFLVQWEFTYSVDIITLLIVWENTISKLMLDQN